MNQYKSELKKKILLVGGLGFLGSHLAKRFAQENWEIAILDDGSSTSWLEVDKAAMVYDYDAASMDVEEIFRIGNIDVVIYLIDKSMDAQNRQLVENAQTNMGGLLNLLQLSSRYQVKHFLYVSSADVFGDSEGRMTEADVPHPVRGQGGSHYFQAHILLNWKQENDLPATVVRLPQVYGPGQQPASGPLAKFFASAVKGKPVTVNIAESRPTQLLYVEDAVYGIYDVVQRGYTGDFIHIAADELISWQEIMSKCQSFMEMPELENKLQAEKEEFWLPQLANDRSKSELGWRQKYKAIEMLEKTYQWYEGHLQDKKRVRVASYKKHRWQAPFRQVRPYMENLACVLVVTLISCFQGNTPVNQQIGFDICYLYIIVMGSLYGRRQSMLAVVFSVLIFTFGLLSRHGELISLLYPPTNILHYSTYIFLGVLTGYMAENKKRLQESTEYKLLRTRQRYEFLQETYQNSISVKDKLYKQIVNSDDSIGWLYKIVQQLDTVEVEDIFTQAAVITSRIMNVENIAIYIMGKDGYYLRQKVRLGEKTRLLPHSLKVEENAYIQTMREKQRLFVNHGLQSGVPDMAAPIVYEDKMIAVIQVYGMDFEQWSIYQQNLLSVTARMISMSMGKAYKYEESARGQKYIGDTRIMQENAFRKLQEGYQERKQYEPNVRNMLLELSLKEMSIRDLDDRLQGTIRVEDSVGMERERVFLLLHDANEQSVELVKNRLRRKAIEVLGIKELM